VHEGALFIEWWRGYKGCWKYRWTGDIAANCVSSAINVPVLVLGTGVDEYLATAVLVAAMMGLRFVRHDVEIKTTIPITNKTLNNFLMPICV